MAHLPLVPLSEFPTELAEAVNHGLQTRMISSTLPLQVWAHRPAVAQAWLATLDQLHNHGILDARVRELVRLRIASYTTCQVCQMARKSGEVSEADVACLASDDPHFSPAERVALRYAELFAADPLSIDDALFARLDAWHQDVEARFPAWAGRVGISRISRISMVSNSSWL